MCFDRVISLFLTLVVFAVLSGCSSFSHRQQQNILDSQIKKGQLDQAMSTAIEYADFDLKTGLPANLLWSLNAGSLLRTQKFYDKSNDAFDGAEYLMKTEDLESFYKNTGETLGSLVINDSELNYEPAVYDGIMVNTYKAMNFWTLGDRDNARIEWNRVDERQRRAAGHFSQKIQRLQRRQQHEAGEYAEAVSYSQALSERLLKQRGEGVKQWQPYKDYVNPFSTYMHGLFFMLNGQTASDYSKALDSFRRAYAMSNNPTVRQDMQKARSLMYGASVKKATAGIWVIFENGLSVHKKEFRIDLPLFITRSRLNYTGIALPRLVARGQAWPYLVANGEKTAVVADMDRIIGAEFRAQFPLILSRELIRATWKTALQYQLSKNSSSGARTAATLYQLVTTSADTRMWNTLPKDFQVTHIPKKSDRVILTAPGMRTPLSVKVDGKSTTSVIYVRGYDHRNLPQISVINI